MFKANEANNIQIDEALLNLDDELQKLTDDIRKIEELIHILSDKIPRHARIHQNFILHLEPDCITISDIATLTPENLLKDKIEVHKIIRLIDQKTINETFIKYKLTDIPLDPITEVHIHPAHLQTLGKSLNELNNLADRIAEQKNLLSGWRDLYTIFIWQDM